MPVAQEESGSTDGFKESGVIVNLLKKKKKRKKEKKSVSPYLDSLLV